MVTNNKDLENIKIILKDFFDEEYYVEQNRDIKDAGIDPLEHYILYGWKEFRNPTPWFDINFYLETYPDIKEIQIDPFLHYIQYGKDEGRKASSNESSLVATTENKISNEPADNFSTKYYLETYPDIKECGIDPFVHFNASGWKEGRNPCFWFDVNFYLETYPDVKEAQVNPFDHFLQHGYKEGRMPNEWFNPDFYRKKYSIETEINPIVHYFQVGWKEGYTPVHWFDAKYYTNRYLQNLKEEVDPFIHFKTYGENQGYFPNPQSEFCNKESFEYLRKGDENYDYEPYREYEALSSKLKLFAFYLPQFHPFKENDEWWGKGFTEWSNVAKAQPNYIGHYQPHIPIHNGFYDLRVPEVMIEQAKLAKNYGISGFNFYYYWFDGKILMKKPFDILLEHPEIDIEFCITWANENWTRRWDGMDNDVLIAQNHTDADSLKFIENMFQYFNDKRYLRIHEKPVLIIYRPDLIPNIQHIIKLWRKNVNKAGFLDIYLIAVKSFGYNNYREDGFDATMEFPPHEAKLESIIHEKIFLNNEFDGAIYDYAVMADGFIEKMQVQSENREKCYKTATLSWDNTARKQDKSTVFDNFSLQKYQEWLLSISEYTLDNSQLSDEEKIIFVNAWNEWAEGTHLEPDKKFGYSYLESTQQVLAKYANTKQILYIGHDALKHGGQILSLHIIKSLKELFGYKVYMLLKGDGPLIKEYEKYATVTTIKELSGRKKNLKEYFLHLKKLGVSKAILNTVVTGDLNAVLKDEELNFQTLQLVHELPKIIEAYNLKQHVVDIANYADDIIFASLNVKDGFNSFLKDLPIDKEHIIPQGLYASNNYKTKKEEARVILREFLNIEKNANVVIAVAYGDHRKGVDLFVDVATKSKDTLQNTYFVWVGDLEYNMEQLIKSKYNIEQLNIIFVPFQKDLSFIYAGADVYLLTSREDPFPSTVLDSLNVGVPVIGFKDAGGFKDVVTDKTGMLVSFEDTKEMDSAVENLIKDKKKQKQLEKNAIALIESQFDWKTYIDKLLSFFEGKR